MGIGIKNISLFSSLVLFFVLVFFMIDLVVLWYAENNSIVWEESFLDKSLYVPEEEKKIVKADYSKIIENLIKKEEKKTLKKAKKKRIEEKIQTLRKHLQEQKKEINKEDIKEEKMKEEGEKNMMDISYSFIPKEFYSQIVNEKKTFWKILTQTVFRSFVEKITVSFYKLKEDVRWKMKNKTVKIFWPQNMKKDELLALFIHEFSHYVDLYFFEREDWADISNEFYDICWYSTIVLNPWLEQKDFVSGYAMTNKYEDFAESLTYYVFHNADFLEKTHYSSVLLKKYYFIKNTLFSDGSFKNTDFSQGNEVRSYYRDITKIPFSEKKFLQYIKKSI